MIFGAVILTAAFVLSAGDSVSFQENDKLYGGSAASITNYPYQCSLQYKNVHKCGASIISHSLALTSRKCFPATPLIPLPVGWKLRCGSATTSSGGTLYKILIIIPHPNYTASTNDYDVAVIKLVTPFILSSTQSIINRTLIEAPANTVIKIAGWGAATSGGTPSSSLMAITGTVYARKKCVGDYGSAVILPSMICTTSTAMNTCPNEGDRGSAVLGTILGMTIQVGIVSWNPGCGNTTLADVHTNLGQPIILAFITALVNQFP